MEFVFLFMCLKVFQGFWAKVVQTSRLNIIHLNPAWRSSCSYTSGFV